MDDLCQQITKRIYCNRTKSIEAEITQKNEEFGDLIEEGTKYISTNNIARGMVCGSQVRFQST
jgi:hypothetical protein